MTEIIYDTIPKNWPSLKDGQSWPAVLSLLYNGRVVRSKRIHLTWSRAGDLWLASIKPQRFAALKEFRFDQTKVIFVSPVDDRNIALVESVGPRVVLKGHTATIDYDSPAVCSIHLR